MRDRLAPMDKGVVDIEPAFERAVAVLAEHEHIAETEPAAARERGENGFRRHSGIHDKGGAGLQQPGHAREEPLEIPPIEVADRIPEAICAVESSGGGEIRRDVEHIEADEAG